MATVHQTLRLLDQYHRKNLKLYDKRFVKSCLEGLGGMGEVADNVALEYLSKNQMDYTREIGKKFLITKATRV